MAATFTTKLGLRKPDPVSDLINVATDINANMDKVDAAIGATSCTSGARPTGSARWTGIIIYETDTGRFYIWNGALWVLLIVNNTLTPATDDLTLAAGGVKNVVLTGANILTTGVFQNNGNASVIGTFAASGHTTPYIDDFEYIATAAGASTQWTSNVTLSSTDLVVNLLAGSTYEIETNVAVSGAAAADIKLAYVSTATVSVKGRHCYGPAIGTTDVTSGAVTKTSIHGIASSVPYGTDGTAASSIQEKILLTCTVSGTFTLQGAQNTSTASLTSFGAGSYMIKRRVA